MDDPRNAIPAALFLDPPRDRAAPPRTLAQAIASHGVNLNAILYTAGGAGLHPTLLLLHGLPGNEQNLDVAQTARRAGWNVLTLHYRGSWGSPGSFSFEHCLDDAAAALRWLREGDHPDLPIDRDRVAIAGHSMGGFVAAHNAAAAQHLLGAALISGVDVGEAFGVADRARATATVDDVVGTSAGLHILAGTSPADLAREARANDARWRLAGYAPDLIGRPLLLVTSDDGFTAGSDALADAVRAIDPSLLETAHLATDHSYSDHRIALQILILRWLDRLVGGYSR